MLYLTYICQYHNLANNIDEISSFYDDYFEFIGTMYFSVSETISPVQLSKI